MDEHPARALVRKKDSSIVVATELVQATARPTRSSPPATPVPAWPRASSSWARCRASTGPRSRSRSWPATGRSCCSTSAPTPTRRPRTSPSTRGWARSSRSACWASRPAGRAALDRRGEGQGRAADRARDRAARRDRPELHRQRRGQGPDPPGGRRRRVRRRPGQRRDQVLRGPVHVHLRPVAHRVPRARSAAEARVPADARRDRAGSARCSTTRRSAGRRCWA